MAPERRICTVMCLQFVSVYLKTGSSLPAYRSNALPNGCEVTVGPAQDATAGLAGASFMPRAPAKASPRTAASAALVNDFGLFCSSDQGILRVSANILRIDSPPFRGPLLVAAPVLILDVFCAEVTRL